MTLLTAAASLALSALLLGPLPAPLVGAQTAPGADSTLVIRVIAEGVIAAVTADDVHPSSYANSFAVFGDDGVLVVDTHHNPGAASLLLGEIRRQTRVPVRWVVNTHAHPDHHWGNAAYRDAFPDAEFIAHPWTIRELAERSGALLASEEGRLRGRADRFQVAIEGGAHVGPALEAYQKAHLRAVAELEALVEMSLPGLVLPSVPIAETRALDLGGRTVTVLHPGPAHTPGDLVVFVDDLALLLAGDLVEAGGLWLEGANVEGWARALENLEALGATQVLAAHGRVRSDDLLLRTHRALLNRALAFASSIGYQACLEGNGPDSAGNSGPGGAAACVVSAFEDLRGDAAAIGLSGSQFDSYVSSLVAAVPAPSR